MNPATGTFTTMDTYQGSIFDPTSLHKYLYANANPVMNVDPSGYFGIADHEAAMAGSAELDKAEAMQSQFALRVWRNFIKKIGIGAIGGFIAVGDQLSAGITDPEQLLLAFRNGFFAGFACSFATGKIALALGGIGVVSGFAGAVDSIKEGRYWQGLYRISLSILGGVGLYNAKIKSQNSEIPSKISKNQDPFMPDEYYSRKIDPDTYYQEPNTIREFQRIGDRTHDWEKSLIVSDEYGRIKLRIDFSCHAQPDCHTNPHVHIYEINTSGSNKIKYGIKWFDESNHWYIEKDPSPQPMKQ